MVKSDDWRVGHPLVDAQHGAILHLVGEVHRCVRERNAAATRKALAALWDETVGHFATEEALMEEHAYPERNAHRTAHRLFLEDLEALLDESAEQGLTEEVGAWALYRVPEWISFHIETNDAPLAKFIARKAAAGATPGRRGGAGARKPSHSDP